MKAMKFKTNAKCGGCVSAIGTALNKLIAPDQWSVSLTDPNKVLQVTANVMPEVIIAAVTEAGFKAEQLF